SKNFAKALSAATAATAAGPAKLYVEDVFSTWLYTGNGSTQTITNGIDLSGKGGLVWIKTRSINYDNILMDTLRGTGQLLSTNLTTSQQSTFADVTSFNSNGFTVGSNAQSNGSSQTLASWTFRKAAKFFDVVTYVGDGNASKTISHNLGSTPGFLIVKRTDSTGQWQCYHRGLTSTNYYIQLNQTSAQQTLGSQVWGVSSTNFTVYGAATDTNINGAIYVAYLFAHDAGGFGDSGNDNIVSCGSYTGTGTPGLAVTLGFEPQWVMVKNASSAAYTSWFMFDNMRGMAVGDGDPYFYANSSLAESGATSDYINPTATGFTLNNVSQVINESGVTYIYIAIRRGPMKTPTDATKVFNATTSAASTGTVITTNFPIDLQIVDSQVYGGGAYWSDRLRGVSTQNVNETKPYLYSYSTDAEQTTTQYTRDWSNTGFDIPSYTSGGSTAYWSFRRAPGFFDVVAYTGTGTFGTAISHNLGVAPEMIILKSRSATSTRWPVYQKFFPTTGGNQPEYGTMFLNTNDGWVSGGFAWANTIPTSTQFSVGFTNEANASGATYIAYLFASCPGVSKVGNYTGSGTTKQIDCGFTAGARFVLIKRTDSTGDWYVWDTARGIISGNDPYLLINSSAAEVTNTDYIDPLNSGFEISSTAPAAINANGGSFIYLAIA
ncbi:MAG: hypothetical protein M1363_07130, partial [Gammaproteobacteria bacterium]|nr:hypothetical protein [Gammaproteobacteria bacterium]